MRNPFKELPEEDKRKALNKILWTFGITVFIIGWVFFFINFGSNNETDNKVLNYTFVFDGEKMDSIMVCEDEWHYELIDNFIPCVVNGTIGGIGGETVDWKVSPQDNCYNVGGEFMELNIYNDTRSKELYDALLPKCFDIKENEISSIWLEVSECVCLDCAEDVCLIGNETLEFRKNCDVYDCGGGLIVQKKDVE